MVPEKPKSQDRRPPMKESATLTRIRLACVVGARPNFMKMAPLLLALENHPNVEVELVHTGQHYDEGLSDVFFSELGMRPPDVCLEVGSGKHGVQTARAIERLEAFLEDGGYDGRRFDRVVVVGDVNSTMAASLAAVKLGISVAHVEAGLRSFDRSMPEEINRIVTDAVSDLLFVSEPSGMVNLQREGHPAGHLHLVGNTMIDTLFRLLPKARESDVLRRHALPSGRYGVVTLHRPSNVDDAETLAQIVQALVHVSRDLPMIFPIHPRTRQRLERFGLLEHLRCTVGIITTPPLGYLDFLALTSQAQVIVTDSGGLQEESTALGIPCLTMRSNTERPITVEQGTSTLIGNDPVKLREHLQMVLEGTYKRRTCPAPWDGQAAPRIAKVLVQSTR